MTEDIQSRFPKFYMPIDESTRALGFDMASDERTGSLLRTLAASKPGGKFLELGTGTGLSTAWILDGMDAGSTLISVDFDARLLDIAQQYLGEDSRLTLVLQDAGEWINLHAHQLFDYIFADTWHGKYLMLEEGLSMLKPGGIYIMDDMLPQSNWPEGHYKKAEKLVDLLENREDLVLTKQIWATGIIVAVKKNKPQSDSQMI